jgi:hypothetical protein
MKEDGRRTFAFWVRVAGGISEPRKGVNILFVEYDAFILRRTLMG